MIRESFRNDSGTVPRSLRTSRARADQGAGNEGEGAGRVGHFAYPTYDRAHRQRRTRRPLPTRECGGAR